MALTQLALPLPSFQPSPPTSSWNAQTDATPIVTLSLTHDRDDHDVSEHDQPTVDRMPSPYTPDISPQEAHTSTSHPADDGNILRALLNTSFKCYHCSKHHRAGSQQIYNCQKAFTISTIGYLPIVRWDVERAPYYARQDWLKHNTLLSAHIEATFSVLMASLDAVKFYDDGFIASPLELASPNGAQQLQARYDDWSAYALARKAQCKTDAQPFLDALNQLLPPPYPTNPPTGTWSREHGLQPDPSSQIEVQRVQRLFTPPATVITEEKRLMICVTHFGALHDRRSQLQGTTLRKLRTIFSSNIYQWTVYSSSSRTTFMPDDLGLDPEFWSSVSLYGGTLTLTTSRFATLHGSS